MDSFICRQTGSHGYNAEEIGRRVEKMLKRVESQFIMPSVNLFCQSGNMNQYAAKFCKLCGFHPVFKMSQSKLSLIGVRGGKLENAWRRFIRWHLLRKRRISTDVIFISHVGCTVEQQDFIRHEVLRCIPFKKIIMQRASVTLACNSGIGTFGLAYYVNASKKDF
ncbi:MAG: hypothetical protein HFI75_04870 [Lachnospiraceae bacterium]|nr:hypothetical protein [Lachnospiraceae bacterium]